jgi:flagellar biosynthesis protein
VTKIRNAVAISYAPGELAPHVVAKGQGLIAEAIIARAHEAGVSVHESEDLVRMLMRLDIDQQIPTELYRVVAELLAWVYLLERRAASKRPGYALNEKPF